MYHCVGKIFLLQFGISYIFDISCHTGTISITCIFLCLYNTFDITHILCRYFSKYSSNNIRGAKECCICGKDYSAPKHVSPKEV